MKKQPPNNINIVTEADILKNHYKFVHDSDDQQSQSNQKVGQNQSLRQRSREKEKTIYQEYGQKMIKKYEQKLFKEFALVDLSRFETGKIGCRWRTEKQLKNKKGQQICAEVNCSQVSKSVFEMNFGYIQRGNKKNALVKVSVCPKCEIKLNYRKKLKQVNCEKNIKSNEQDN